MRRLRAFSLLEILVVMVVLLIGILAVVRLFPGGFLAIQRTGEQTTGTQLAEQQLDLLRSLPVLPDYIVPGLPDSNGGIHEISNIRPDDLTEATDQDVSQLATANGFTIFPNYPGYYFSNINRFGYIKGETFYIPVSNPNIVDGSNKPYGSIALLQLGPVFNYFNTSGGQTTDSLHVYGAALTRTLQSAVASTDRPDARALLRNEAEYAIDYDNHIIAFFPRVAQPGMIKSREFQITFDYYDTSANPPTLKTQTGKIVVQDIDPTTVVAGVLPQPVWQDIFSATNPAPTNAKDEFNIRHESDDVSRAFKLITTDYNGGTKQTFEDATAGPGWSDDAYEYAWFSGQQTGDSNDGVLVFNPKAHVSILADDSSDPLTQAQGQSFTNNLGLVARVDYLTYDNHILRDQRTVPSSAPYTIKLSVPNLLTYNDILDDGSTYTGLFNVAAGTVQPDIIVVNANDGTEVAEYTNNPSAGSNPTVVRGNYDEANHVRISVDTVAGTITLAATAQPGDTNLKGVEDLNLQGKSLRVYYRTQKNWGMQLQKASSVYTATTNPDTLDYKTFFIGQGGTNGFATRLYFAPSEAGKTVSLSEFYLKTASGTIYSPFKNATFKIQDAPLQFESLGTKGILYPWIDVRDSFPNADAEHVPQGGASGDAITGFTAAPTGRAVSQVRGLSVKSRVIWKDRNNFRRIDQDSVLTTDRLQ